MYLCFKVGSYKLMKSATRRLKIKSEMMVLYLRDYQFDDLTIRRVFIDFVNLITIKSLF